MSSRFLFFQLSFLSSAFICPSYAMLITGHTVVSPDQKRYIAFLGHYHQQADVDYETQQLDDLVAICRQGVHEGKKFHILYERSGDCVRPFQRHKSVLSDLEQTFAEAQVPDCTIENIELRESSNAASYIFDREGKIFNYDWASWNEGSKPFNELTFEDVFEEFEKYAVEIEPFVEEVVQKNPECPYTFGIQDTYTKARRSLDKIKNFLQSNELLPNTKILSFARERTADCRMLRSTNDDAFSDLFNLRIFCRVLQLDPTVQTIVIAGGMHAIEVKQLLQLIKWKDARWCGAIFAKIQKPITYRQMRTAILDESEWAQITKDTYTSLISIKIALTEKFTSLRDSIL